MRSRIDIPVEPAWPEQPNHPRLNANEVHVWSVSLDQAQSQMANAAATLCPEEQARARRFHFERDRNRFVVARGSLRLLLGRYLRVSPSEIIFDYSARGKPSLANTSGRGSVHFNLAHSGGLALIAVMRVAELGVDVEQSRLVEDAGAIAQRFFSARESAILRSLAPPEMQAVFFNLWTRKEAWLKATGEGIGESLNQVEVSCLSNEPTRVISLFGDAEAAREWRLIHLTPANGYVGALAIRAPEIELKRWHFNLVGMDSQQ
jgi:4'-phosphopantetheinyl transferase